MPDEEDTPIINSDHHSSDKPSTSGNSHRRPATEKRKQQNRIAQQKYREKQKRLLAQLKLRTAWDDDARFRPRNLLPENETPTSDLSPNVEYFSNQNDTTVDCHGVGPRRLIEPSEDLAQLNTAIGAEQIAFFERDASSLTDLENITASPIHTLDDNPGVLPSDTSQILGLPPSDPLNFRDKLQRRPDVFDSECGQDFSDLSQVSSSTLHVDDESTLSSPRRILLNTQFLESNNVLTRLAAELPSIESSRSQKSSSPIPDGGPHKFSGSFYSRLPDPHVNSFTLTIETTLSAILHNAHSLGLTLDEMYDDDSMSCFYRQNLTLADDINLIQESLAKNVMPDLRPTLTQILCPHHSCYDLIPFPTLRTRTIELLACTPPVIDESELEDDIFNGLICWRTASRGSGQPWDMRSWEVQPWFFKKWGILLGGEEGEAWRQTMWWRAMRGETDSI
ncbi:hypothetical protein V1508DRAFT_373435 [Lipomyces doorenjongii]|uniref:uncharacterized protein n=1 Tax=Lipomyces doorenjongii TaxID=383834 RepID=UPI0034CDC667